MIPKKRVYVDCGQGQGKEICKMMNILHLSGYKKNVFQNEEEV
ncbi:hypothetical protein ELI_1053 [Eubacterium callanderi]|uniref:Uncharacterized protein n=1 Tax=Eubacterium callanderi TaxID=53442 RepID=E3GJT0_9FIRM|nr:hypothetical protein ELI_1053 [Eubacterium callanderi]